MLPPSLTADISVQLRGTGLPPSTSNGDPNAFVDVRASLFANSNASSPATRARNLTITNVVWGAGNSHSMKTLDMAVMLVDAAVQQRTTLGGAVLPPVDLVLFPETFLYNGSNAEVINGNVSGPIIRAMRVAARRHGVYIVATTYELPGEAPDEPQDGPMYNSAVLIGRNGTVEGVYRKHFPTDYEIAAAVRPGERVPVFDLDCGRVAILTCWDFNFPELWQAVGAQGADAVLWPSAAKGAENVQGHALNGNFFIASNGAGQFYDQLGRQMSTTARNVTVKGYTKPVLLTTATLDLDSAVVFYGGPSAKQHKISDFLAMHTDDIAVAWTSDVSKMHLLRATTPGFSVRTALRAARIETRQEEETRNRLVANQARVDARSRVQAAAAATSASSISLASLPPRDAQDDAPSRARKMLS